MAEVKKVAEQNLERKSQETAKSRFMKNINVGELAKMTGLAAAAAAAYYFVKHAGVESKVRIDLSPKPESLDLDNDLCYYFYQLQKHRKLNEEMYKRALCYADALLSCVKTMAKPAYVPNGVDYMWAQRYCQWSLLSARLLVENPDVKGRLKAELKTLIENCIKPLLQRALFRCQDIVFKS